MIFQISDLIPKIGSATSTDPTFKEMRTRSLDRLKARLAQRQLAASAQARPPEPTVSPEVAEARRVGLASGYAEVGEILKLCQDAGKPERARGFLASGATVAEAQNTLLEEVLADRKRAQIAARRAGNSR